MLPLRFHPLFRRYVWGGRRLGTVLQKPIGAGDDYAESWEVVDRGPDQSVVSHGPLAGRTLHELVTRYGPDLLGRHHPQASFPLLFKFLDARDKLSVQVHPNDERAGRLDPPDRGKTEAWVILEADPESVIFAGLKRGFDRQALAREVARETTSLCLHRLTPQVGDCIFLPAGAVHALGAGLLVAELQQASDTTYRLFDWNRAGRDGKLRPLQVEAALEAIDYQLGPVVPQVPQSTEDPDCELLVACDQFVLRRWRSANGRALPSDDRCRLLAVLQGQLRVDPDPVGLPLARGATLLVPAACRRLDLHPVEGTVWLEAYLPD